MRVLLLVFAVISNTYAQAPSFLGLCHKTWNCDATIEFYASSKVIVTGWLENTFNGVCDCADKLLSDARDKIVRVHLVNSPCMRNKRCGKYEVLYNHTKASGSRLFTQRKGRGYKRFLNTLLRIKTRFDNAVGPLTCYVSPCLECDLNVRARRVMADLVSAALPNCYLVDNPYRQRCIRGTICEKHGATPGVTKPCIVDTDGTDGTTIDIKKWVDDYNDCDLRYYWETWMNCIRGDFIDPRKRDCIYDVSMFNRVKEILCQSFYPSFATCLP